MKVVTNSKGSGDWIIINDIAGRSIWEGHSIKASDLVDILASVNIATELIECDDETVWKYENF